MQKLEILTPEGYKRVETTKNGTTHISFEKIENKPKTAEYHWREVVRNYLADTCVYWIDEACRIETGNIYQSTDPSIMCRNAHRVEAFAILQALVTARDYYNEGWVADWTDEYNTKYIIESYKNKVYKEDYCVFSRILNFKTEEIRDKFHEDFKEWIEIVCKEGLI